ncbi:MAG: DUF222 domain-containing protein, partial [Candidatus Nanopelagicales bacterium]
MFDNGGSRSATGVAGVDVRDGLASLTRDLDLLSQVDPSDVPGDGLGEVIVGLMAQARRLAAMTSVMAARFASSGAWAGDGARSAEAWVSSRVNEHHRTARRIADVGRSLAEFPVMGAALTDGLVGVEHMRVLA